MASPAKLTGVAPILLVRDFAASVAYWREKLGFETQVFNHPPDFCIARRDGVSIMLSALGPGVENKPNWQLVHHMWNAYVWVDDARSLYEEFRAAGALIDYELHEKPYGCLEFGIQDLDGHDIAFGQIIR